MAIQRLMIFDEAPAETNTRHFVGLPPLASDDTDDRTELPVARLLILKESSEGVFLYRFDEYGTEVGDTWHASVDDALHQVSFEYPGSQGQWANVDGELEEIVKRALASLQQ